MGDHVAFITLLQAIFSSQEVTQVNIAAASGDMGILANHVPAIEPLKPGVIEVIEAPGQSKKWFGGWKACMYEMLRRSY